MAVTCSVLSAPTNNEGQVPQAKSPDEQLAAAIEDAACSSAPLNERLMAIARTEARLFQNLFPAYDRFVSRAALSDAHLHAPAIGSNMPDVTLTDSSGHLTQLSSLWKDRSLVISLNRGHWCLYCTTQLHMLAEHYPEIMDLGADVVSIMPETEEFAEVLSNKTEAKFKTLSDLDLGYALQLGLAVWIGEEIKSLYIEGGLDISKFQANDGWLLPIPATFVVDKGGRVRARFVDPDFRHRMPMEDLIAALRASRSAIA